jgi:predicted nuclease of restriction endonuclease-like (RecB) superfamily
VKQEILDQQGYAEFLGALKSSIRQRQYQALRAVNKELIALYWDIGKLIDERQETEGWGKAVVERLSADLRNEFGEKSGFSGRNLWYMRTFYREYKEQPIMQPLAAEISWTKNTLILDRCQHPLQREFYLRACARFGCCTSQTGGQGSLHLRVPRTLRGTRGTGARSRTDRQCPAFSYLNGAALYLCG